jgi:hypothetical protein
MKELRVFSGVLAASFFASAFLVGCSDEVKPTGPSTSNRSPSNRSTRLANTGAAMGSQLAAKTSSEVSGSVPASNSGAGSASNAKPPAPIAPHETPGTKAAAKPDDKGAAKPLEGKVEVKAQPDSETESVPASKSSAKPVIKKEASPSATTVGDENTPPKISTFASADDLAAELKIFVADLEKAVATQAEYNDQPAGRFERDGNTVTLLAIALGLHDQDSPFKPYAKAIAAAARKVARAKNYDPTAKAVAALKAAADGKVEGGDQLKWEKVASLNDLMTNQVPSINNRLKTSLKHFKQEGRAAAASANAATMALIAQNAKLYLDETQKPTETKKWQEFTDQLLAASEELAAKAHAGSEPEAKAAFDKMDKSCHACHAVFNPKE